MAWNPSASQGNQAQRALLRAQAQGVLAQAAALGANGASSLGGPINKLTHQSSITNRLFDEYYALQAIPNAQKTPAQKKRFNNLEVSTQLESRRLINIMENLQAEKNAANAKAAASKSVNGVKGHSSGSSYDIFAPREPNSNTNMFGGRRRRRNTRRRKSRRASTRKNRK